MTYGNQLAVLVATLLESVHSDAEQWIEEMITEQKDVLVDVVVQFLTQEVTPERTFDFEHSLGEVLRETGRRIVENVFNRIEPEEPTDAPHDVTYQLGGYRRLNKKTSNRDVCCLFGPITLTRLLYRFWHRDQKESSIFPLELQLGLVEGATPALAEAAARYMAEAGATQRVVLARLKEQHDVRWGPERLRKVTAHISDEMTSFRQELQVQRLLELLDKAARSSGRYRPSMAVGRDGVTLRQYRHSGWEHASAGTVTVYDRRGKRLGTVYLAFTPESGQGRMTDALTALIRDVLTRWEGKLPRLCYVTDAGDNETNYFKTVLRNMRHPRTKERLTWQRIVDYYHTSERVWTMAESLFGAESKAGHAWARRMCRVLKEPDGPRRVLLSAAALRGRTKLSKSCSAEFDRATNYIRRRTRYMQYHAYQRVGLPIGSGITEAACKTIFTQRMKLSGMRWEKDSAQQILNLRVILLSDIWPAAYRQMLANRASGLPGVYRPSSHGKLQNAA